MTKEESSFPTELDFGLENTSFSGGIATFPINTRLTSSVRSAPEAANTETLPWHFVCPSASQAQIGATEADKIIDAVLASGIFLHGSDGKTDSSVLDALSASLALGNKLPVSGSGSLLTNTASESNMKECIKEPVPRDQAGSLLQQDVVYQQDSIMLDSFIDNCLSFCDPSDYPYPHPSSAPLPNSAQLPKDIFASLFNASITPLHVSSSGLPVQSSDGRISAHLSGNAGTLSEVTHFQTFSSQNSLQSVILGKSPVTQPAAVDSKKRPVSEVLSSPREVLSAPRDTASLSSSSVTAPLERNVKPRVLPPPPSPSPSSIPSSAVASSKTSPPLVHREPPPAAPSPRAPPSKPPTPPNTTAMPPAGTSSKVAPPIVKSSPAPQTKPIAIVTKRAAVPSSSSIKQIHPQKAPIRKPSMPASKAVPIPKSNKSSPSTTTQNKKAVGGVPSRGVQMPLRPQGGSVSIATQMPPAPQAVPPVTPAPTCTPETSLSPSLPTLATPTLSASADGSSPSDQSVTDKDSPGSEQDLLSGYRVSNSSSSPVSSVSSYGSPPARSDREMLRNFVDSYCTQPGTRVSTSSSFSQSTPTSQSISTNNISLHNMNPFLAFQLTLLWQRQRNQQPS
mmetsp:Transcript_29425/g.49498  ORF Transcript_29425/g.49498 Transcript_29425/m.49498 type:complete len:621 (-) Transcript_29425:356-2218(-)